MSAQDSQDWVTVETTFPIIPPNAERKAVKTQRLLLRPFQEDDLVAFRELRTQPEVMIHTVKGCIDYTVEETREVLQKLLPPNDSRNFQFGVFLASTGELIGEGGVHTLETPPAGWPEIGYKFKKEHWGKGYGTEFLQGFLEAWWSLPRTTKMLQVIGSSVEGKGNVMERVYADALLDNQKSGRVLQKVGFKKFREWTEIDKRPGQGGVTIDLAGYYLLRKDV